MIGLLRSLRKKTTNNGKTQKYLLYALGEIALVVIGILIALQINNWHTDYQNRRQEKQILKQLREEYGSNLLQIKEKIEIRNLMVQSFLTLLSYRTSEGVTSDSVDFHLQRVMTWPTFDPELGITNELISSGKLYLIENGEIRKQLTTWFKYVDELKEEEVILTKWIVEDLYRFIRKHYQIGNIQKTVDSGYRELYSLTEGAYFDNIEFIQGDTEGLLGHPDFEDLLAQILWHVQYTNIQSAGVRQAIETILLLLDNELAEH